MLSPNISVCSKITSILFEISLKFSKVISVFPYNLYKIFLKFLYSFFNTVMLRNYPKFIKNFLYKIFKIFLQFRQDLTKNCSKFHQKMFSNIFQMFSQFFRKCLKNISQIFYTISSIPLCSEISQNLSKIFYIKFLKFSYNLGKTLLKIV